MARANPPPSEKKILPGISYNASNLVFPNEFFVINYFHKKVFGYSSVRSKRFFIMLLNNPNRSLKYLMLWLKLGKDIQSILDTLHKERTLNLDSIKRKIKLDSHPIVKLNLEGSRGIKDFRDRKISDKYLLVWNEVLNDFLFYISEHVQQFLTACQNTNLPSYASIARKSSNRE